MSKLAELLAELNEEIINYGAAPVTQREYDLLRVALREREGMVMVPREPTEAMIQAAREHSSVIAKSLIPMQPLNNATWQASVIGRWKAMLAAAEGK